MAMRPFDNISTTFALDPNALANLKREAQTAPEKALRAAAGQFEALFLQMLLKSMREALPQDGPLTSETSKMVTGMFDQQLAQQLSNKGLGIADMMVKQLSRPAAKPADANATTTSETTSAKGLGIADPMMKQLSRPAARPADARVMPTSETTLPPLKLDVGTKRSATSATPANSTGSSLAGHVKDFIEKMRPHAEAAARAAGLPTAFVLAQAGLESGWGRHQARNADGAPSHNLFGIKAGKSWNGAVVESATTEHAAGRPVKTVGRFRSYGSYAESLQDFARLVRQSPRFKAVAEGARDADSYARGMQKAGYATDPDYGAKLARAIRMVERQGMAASAPVRAPQVIASGADTGGSGRTQT